MENRRNLILVGLFALLALTLAKSACAQVKEAPKVSDSTIVVLPGQPLPADARDRVKQAGGKLTGSLDDKPARISSRLTLLVFKDNSISAVTDYWVEDGVLYYPSASGSEIAVPLEQVDLGLTVQLNRERGVKFALRAKPSAVSGTVRVTSNPQGADVRVDGAFFGNAPATLKLSPVKHTIRVSLAGYKDWSREVSVPAGSELELTAFLKR